ncbi:MAG: bifunctional diguanylate cyclase/phosphodiesterase [Pseudomonadota bacterium]|nr:bifunctional diguanylate cyclase/phosphodiesterase [Pseudomonadota bacterium]
MGAGRYIRWANRARTTSSRSVGRNIAAIVLGAILLSVAALYWAARQSDQVSVERQGVAAQHALDMTVNELALQQETVAIWDDAAKHLLEADRDMSWIHGNVGSWLHQIFDHDVSVLLDGTNRSFYAAREGRQVALSSYVELAPDIEPLVAQLRDVDPRYVGPHDRVANRPLAADSHVRTTARATHTSRLMSLGGRPAAVSATLVNPSTSGYVRQQGPWPILVSARYLDGGFLKRLSDTQLIDLPRISQQPVTSEGEHAIPIVGDLNRTIGYFIWRPSLPGTTVARKLLPPTLLSLFLLISFILILGKRLTNTVAELARTERQAVRIARMDSLTGLPNRGFFQLRLDEARKQSSAGGRGFALALVDLDDFKLVNDTMGHDAGDQLLVTVARRLRSAVREGDFIARLGGDEFAVIFGSVTDQKEVNRLCGRLVDHLNQPLDYQGKAIDCRVSIGASIARSADRGDDLLKEADLALYECKGAGRGAYRLYHPSMWRSVLERQQMMGAAKVALADDQIRPFYQPKVDLESGRLVGFEALLRLRTDGRQVRGPQHIEAAFQDPPLASQISARMVELVLKDLSSWRALGLDFGHVAINAGAGELRSRDFASDLLKALKRHEVPASCIQLEVTEGVLLGRAAANVGRLLRVLTRNGIRLALDDFGTGFASLTHLKQFPIDVIKIDRRFVRNLQVDAEDGAIVNAIVGLAGALKIDVVAEGIETEAQREFLSALGCKTGQGYLFGAAVSSAEARELLERSKLGRLRAA